jgi:hypothetical protein
MRYAPRALLAGGLTLAACSLAACGGDAGLLSGDQANNFNAALDSVSTAVQNGNCAAANNAADSLRNEVANLPPSINRTLTQVLNQGASTVAERASIDCRSGTTTTDTTTTASTPKTTTSSTTTTSTTTTSSTPTSSTTSSSTSSTTSSTATTTGGSGTSTNGSGGAGITGGNGTGGGSAQ